uniref:Uncharacterized protein n=1 Tax=Romanomermis culicivorax TaxID=13658 RepID=A0A915IWU0_ROMCU
QKIRPHFLKTDTSNAHFLTRAKCKSKKAAPFVSMNRTTGTARYRAVSRGEDRYSSKQETFTQKEITTG